MNLESKRTLREEAAIRKRNRRLKVTNRVIDYENFKNIEIKDYHTILRPDKQLILIAQPNGRLLPSYIENNIVQRLNYQVPFVKVFEKVKRDSFNCERFLHKAKSLKVPNIQVEKDLIEFIGDMPEILIKRMFEADRGEANSTSKRNLVKLRVFNSEIITIDCFPKIKEFLKKFFPFNYEIYKDFELGNYIYLIPNLSFLERMKIQMKNRQMPPKIEDEKWKNFFMTAWGFLRDPEEFWKFLPPQDNYLSYILKNKLHCTEQFLKELRKHIPLEKEIITVPSKNGKGRIRFRKKKKIPKKEDLKEEKISKSENKLTDNEFNTLINSKVLSKSVKQIEKTLNFKIQVSYVKKLLFMLHQGLKFPLTRNIVRDFSQLEFKEIFDFLEFLRDDRTKTYLLIERQKLLFENFKMKELFINKELSNNKKFHYNSLEFYEFSKENLKIFQHDLRKNVYKDFRTWKKRKNLIDFYEREEAKLLQEDYKDP